jgi:hypothetical protein
MGIVFDGDYRENIFKRERLLEKYTRTNDPPKRLYCQILA